MPPSQGRPSDSSSCPRGEGANTRGERGETGPTEGERIYFGEMFGEIEVPPSSRRVTPNCGEKSYKGHMPCIEPIIVVLVGTVVFVGEGERIAPRSLL